MDSPVVISDAENERWESSARGKKISVKRKPLLSRGTKIFCMGSCFAVEIRKALRARDYDVYPKYGEIEFDPSTQHLALLPHRDNINHYTTFSIHYEFETALGTKPEGAAGYWRVPQGLSHLVTPRLYQAPARKHIYASSIEALHLLDTSIDETIQSSIHAADVYIITLGLTEIWLNNENRLPICIPPFDAPNSRYAKFHLSTFSENYTNMKRVCDLVLTHYPDKHIILTVSPVALQKTHSGRDIVVANSESKAILRSVAGQLEREFDRVHYWPSFEIAQTVDVFREDGRHVSAEGVETIVSNFLIAFSRQ